MERRIVAEQPEATKLNPASSAQTNPPSQGLPPVRNQLIPKQRHLKDSMYYIREYFNHYMHLKQLHPTGNLEIESRVGNYTFHNSKQASGDAIRTSVLGQALNGMVIVGTTLQSINNELIQPNPFYSQLKSGFDPKIPESFFFDRLMLMRNKRFIDGNDVIESSCFSIDLRGNSCGPGARLTYDVDSDRYSFLRKDYKTNLDLCHSLAMAPIQYRLSACLEFTEELTREAFVKKLIEHKINFCRVKLRKNFRYQFMEYSFTKIYELDEKNSLSGGKEMIQMIVTLLQTLKEETKGDDFKSHILSKLEEKTAPQHELEVEIVDSNFLEQYYRSGDMLAFSNLVDRYIRNCETFYHYPDEFGQPDYREYFKSKGIGQIQYPVAGRYLDSIFRSKHEVNKER